MTSQPRLAAARTMLLGLLPDSGTIVSPLEGDQKSES